MLTQLSQLKAGDAGKFIILREEFIRIINVTRNIGKSIRLCAAKLIQYFHVWTKWKVEHQRTDWVYQPLRKIAEHLFHEYSINTIRGAIDVLEDLGFLNKRNNPGNYQDKTYQYRLNEKAVLEAVNTFVLQNDCQESELNPEVSEKHIEDSLEINTIESNTNESNRFISNLKKEKKESTEIFPDPWDDNAANEEEIVHHASFVDEINSQSQKVNKVPSKGKYSGSSSVIPKKRDKYDWEVEIDEPLPMFLRWREDKYKKSSKKELNEDSLAKAYSEFYNRPARTSKVLYPQFLEEQERIHNNVKNISENGGKAILPSYLNKPLPKGDEKDTVTYLQNLKDIAAIEGMHIALPNEAATPSSLSIEVKDIEIGISKPLKRITANDTQNLITANEPKPVNEITDKQLEMVNNNWKLWKHKGNKKAGQKVRTFVHLNQQHIKITDKGVVRVDS